MTKKIVNKDYSVPGMEPLSMFRQLLILKRMPFLNVLEGPRFKYLLELYFMHNLGRIWVNLEVNHPDRYRILMRVRNSLVFRYNHYRRILSKKRNYK